MSDMKWTGFDWAVFAVLLAAVVAAHGGAVNGAFHYDDAHAVVNNPAVLTWDPIEYFRSSKAFSGAGEGGNYRPVTVMSFALNYRVSGMTPSAFLVVNIALHFLTAWLVYVLGRRLLGDARWAAVAAIVYAIHPVNAESVNYVVARSSLLASLGALVALWALMRRHDGARWGLAVAVIAYGLALLSKESALALAPPVVMRAWMPHREAVPDEPVRSTAFAAATDRPRWSWRRDREVVIAFVAVSVLFVALWRSLTSGRLLATGDGGAAYPAWAFLEIVVKSLGLLVWPWPLGLDHPMVFATRFDPVLAVVCLAAVGSLGVLTVWSLRREPFVAWCMVWVIAGLMPLLPIPWLTTQGLFQENRLAFSVAGFAWLAAWFGRAAVTRAAETVSRRTLVAAAAIAGSALVIASVTVDRGRSAVWNDEVRLWREVASHRPDDPRAHVNLGRALFLDGSVAEAAQAFETATRLDPGFLQAAFNLGQAYRRLGRERDAEALYEEGLDKWRRRELERSGQTAPQGSPNDADASGFAQAFRFVLGERYLARNDLDRAERMYVEAAREQPMDFRAWYNLGIIAERRGDLAAAVGAYRTAAALAPNEASVARALDRVSAMAARKSDVQSPNRSSTSVDPVGRRSR